MALTTFTNVTIRCHYTLKG